MGEKTQDILLLYDGQRVYAVAEEFYSSVLKKILSIVPALLPGAPYSAQRLLGREFWDPLEQKSQQLTGRCVADMVRRRKLPLRRVGCKHKYPAQYELDQ